MSDNVLTYTVEDFGMHCTISIDLAEVANSAGKYKEGCLIMSSSKARKLCRDIVDHASQKDFDRISKFFKVNAKLSKIWEDLKCKSVK